MASKQHNLIFALLAVALVILAFITPGFPGSSDGIQHFLISQLAFEQPELFLHQWNKPLYTVFSAGFAQFGFIGIRLMNVMLGFASAVLVYRTAGLNKWPMTMLAPFILLCMPAYLELLPSAMTEPLFAFLVAGIIYTLRAERTAWAMILIGLTPFARQEGYLLIPFAILFLIVTKRLSLIPLLAIGAIVFGMAGFVMLDDPNWLVNSFPYGSGAADIYGSGTWNHFISRYEVLIGTPNAILLVVGLVLLFVHLATNGLSYSIKDPQASALVFSAIIVGLFVVGHSYLWATGSSGSVGLLRVLASTAPAAAYLCFFGFQRIIRLPVFGPTGQKVVGLIVLSLLVFQVPKAITIPYKRTETEKVLAEVSAWCNAHDFEQGKVYYHDPIIYFFTEGKSSLQRSAESTGITGKELAANFKVGDYIIWDAHFSPNEGRLPLDSLIMNPYVQKVKRFTPENAFTVLGGHPYEVTIFKKTNEVNQKVRVDQNRLKEDFEDLSKDYPGRTKNPSGAGHCHLSNPEFMYVTIRDTIPMNEVSEIVKIKATANVYIKENAGLSEFSIVGSISKDGHSFHYSSIGSENMTLEKGWNKIEHVFAMPAALPDPCELVVFIWFRGGETILVDELSIDEEVIKEVAE